MGFHFGMLLPLDTGMHALGSLCLRGRRVGSQDGPRGRFLPLVAEKSFLGGAVFFRLIFLPLLPGEGFRSGGPDSVSAVPPLSQALLVFSWQRLS